MPVDARSLLRASAATRQGGGIVDRFASYHAKTGALRCSACDLQPIKHESLWGSHVASKSHRANAQRIEQTEAEAEEQRKKESESATAASGNDTSQKRKPPNESDDTADHAKRSKTSDVNQDDEWARFQAEVLNAAPARAAARDGAGSSAPSYVDATIEVAPVLNAQGGGGDDGEDADGILDPTAVSETAEEKRQRLEREAREEILARIDEEQRVQEEADDRVRALKERLSKIRQAQAARKAGDG